MKQLMMRITKGTTTVTWFPTTREETLSTDSQALAVQSSRRVSSCLTLQLIHDIWLDMNRRVQSANKRGNQTEEAENSADGRDKVNKSQTLVGQSETLWEKVFSDTKRSFMWSLSVAASGFTRFLRVADGSRHSEARGNQHDEQL